jgi:esterase/lipase superfamily enzyme
MLPKALIAAAAACLILIGCTPRGQITMLPEAGSVGTVHEMLTVTSRGPEDGPGIYSRSRAETLRWGRFNVSVPPEREPGTVSFPDGRTPDPARHFLTVSAQRFADEQAFLAAVNAALARRPAGQREVTVFVHGFNTNFSEGLYRHAQMAHDFRSPGVSVFYAWPSAASVRAYPFDRESALFARDGLERLLDVLSRSNAEKIVPTGHSMGALVVMDTVRQMAIRGSDRSLAKVQAVLLMAPDLDIDVFRTQAAAVAARRVPIYVFVSDRDRALRLSGFLRGQEDRLGSIRDRGRLAGLADVVVVDVTDVQGSAGDPLNHFPVATSPAMIALIAGLDQIGIEMFKDQERQPNVFETTINVVQGVTEVVLQPLVE